MKSKTRLFVILSIVAVLLLIPLVAMYFTDEVNWGVMDFTIAGLMLLSLGWLIGFGLRKIKESRYRIVVGAIVVAFFVLAWMEMAVGLFGTPLAGD